MEKAHPLTGTPVRPFRFGVVAAAARSADEWLAKVRRVEALGYATLVIPDNMRYTLAPIPALSVAAAVTTTLRLGTYVLADDLRHPVALAKEVATLDLLSSGRVELGIGAGRPDSEAENRMLGLPFDSGGVRVARLAESIQLLKGSVQRADAVERRHVLPLSGRRNLAVAGSAAAPTPAGGWRRPPDAQPGCPRGRH